MNMRYPTAKNTTAIFAALIPLLIITLFFITQGKTQNQQMDNHDEAVHSSAMNWDIHVDEVVFSSDEIARLTRQLHNEASGNQRANVLDSLLVQITARLTTNEEPTPLALTDLLRDISVAHPDNDTRLFAYTAMIKALENEEFMYDERDDLVSN